MNKLSVFIILSLFNISLIFGQETKINSPYLESSPKSNLRSNLNLAYLQQTTKQDSSKASLHAHPGYILPKKVLFFSVIIPGTGELYCRSFVKSAVFFGIEVGAWVMYATFQKRGKDKEDDYELYANTYWDEDKWQAWFTNLTEEEQKVFSHDLPDAKTQQYYEMIGKYDQFIVGWPDAPPDLKTSGEDNSIYNYYSEYRENYMDMRYDSNKLLKRATTSLYLVMFNHLFSAIDAAWTAKRHNSRIVKTSLRFENKYFNNENHTMLTLNVNWK